MVSVTLEKKYKWSVHNAEMLIPNVAQDLLWAKPWFHS